jgi:hypothetical protein
LASNPYECRTGLVPLSAGIVLGWVFVGLWLWVAVIAFSHSFVWSFLVAGSTIVFSIFLTLFTVSLIRDSYRDFQYELNETEAVVTVTDRMIKRKATQMVLLKDIKYAEYYPYTDSSCVILHTSNLDMEVPLWPLGTRAQDVVDFLSGHGVQLMNVQFDDKVPG